MDEVDLRRDPLPLRGRTVLVTGVSRRAGVGYAIARRVAAYGASVVCHHYAAHDAEKPWGADDLAAVVEGVREQLTEGATLVDLDADLTLDGAPEQVVAQAVEAVGHVDALVCNQGMRGPDAAVGTLTGEMLDRHFAVNTRASLLLTQAYARQHDPGRPGAVVYLTSGQGLGPMPGEVAYAAAKGALAGVTTTVADQLADERIRVNTVNPGPVDTGYVTAEEWASMAPMFPFGRYGRPDDPARLVAWLLTDEAEWVSGQVISSEGGFGRWRPRGRPS